MKRPKLSPSPRSQPRRRARRAAGRRGGQARPDPLRRLGEEGHRGRFLDRFGRGGRDSSAPSTSSTADPPGEQAVDRVDDRHVDAAFSRASRASTGAVNAPSATVRRSAISSAAERPSPMPLPSEKLRELVDEQVRTRSPRPGQAGQRFAPRAAGEPEAGHFGKAAGDQRGAGILAEALALDHAAGDRQHVLDRAADLGAGDVVAEINAEGRLRDALAQALRPEPDPRRQGSPPSAGPRATSCAKVGPESTAIGAFGQASRATSWSSSPLLSSMPLEHRISGLSQSGARSSTARMCCAGRDDQPGVALVEFGEVARSRGSPGRAGRRRERPGFRGRVDRLDDLGLASPTASVSRPPAAATWASAVPHAPPPMRTAELHALTPAPRTFSALSSSGQRARAGASSGSVSPAASRSAPGPGDHRRIVGAQPGGRDAEAAALRAPRGRRARRGSRRLAATPPATTSAGASARLSASAVRSTRQSTTACWKLAAMSSRRMFARCHRALDRALEAGEGEMRLARADQRARQRHGRRDRRRAPAPRSPGRRDSQAEQLGGLVERFARRIVDGRRQPAVIADPAHFEQLAMAARDQQQQIGKIEIRIDQPRRQRMAFEMVDRDQRLARGQRQPLAGEQRDHHAADQARARRSRRWRRPRRPTSRPRRAPGGSGRAGSRHGRGRRSPAPPRHRAGAPAFWPTTAWARIRRSLSTSAAALSSHEDSRPRIRIVISRPALCLKPAAMH